MKEHGSKTDRIETAALQSLSDEFQQPWMLACAGAEMHEAQVRDACKRLARKGFAERRSGHVAFYKISETGRSELSRLRNGGGDSKTEEGRAQAALQRWESNLFSDGIGVATESDRYAFQAGYEAALADSPSPQSPAEPGHGDMLARQERMAEGFDRLVKIIEAWRTSNHTARWIAQRINEAGLLASPSAKGGAG